MIVQVHVKSFFSSFKASLLVYIGSLVGFLIYSYTQVDLNLTISNNIHYQKLQQMLTQIGYFNRPLSAIIFVGFLATMTTLYFFFIRLARNSLLNKKRVRLLIGVTLLLVFAYPAFSHDIFNYIFDARIVTQYHLSPYFFKALDFPLDPWVRFMRWTHRYYPYGPFWLVLSLIPSYLGLGKFILTLLLFKVMFASFHALNCYLIYKISVVLERKQPFLPVIIYALNPLIIIESLMSPHNEVMMLMFTLLSIYFFLQKKVLFAIISIFAGGFIKFISFMLTPLFFTVQRNEKILYWIYGLWLLALYPLVMMREFYSWYLIPTVAFASLIKNKWIQSLTIALSIGLLMRYAPYLWFGDYGANVRYYQNVCSITGAIGIFLIFIFLWKKEHS